MLEVIKKHLSSTHIDLEELLLNYKDEIVSYRSEIFITQPKLECEPLSLKDFINNEFIPNDSIDFSIYFNLKSCRDDYVPCYEYIYSIPNPEVDLTCITTKEKPDIPLIITFEIQGYTIYKKKFKG